MSLSWKQRWPVLCERLNVLRLATSGRRAIVWDRFINERVASGFSFFHQRTAVNNYIQLRKCGDEETWAHWVYGVVTFSKRTKQSIAVVALFPLKHCVYNHELYSANKLNPPYIRPTKSMEIITIFCQEVVFIHVIHIVRCMSNVPFNRVFNE